jgi:hypothetical protein
MISINRRGKLAIGGNNPWRMENITKDTSILLL